MLCACKNTFSHAAVVLAKILLNVNLCPLLICTQFAWRDNMSSAFNNSYWTLIKLLICELFWLTAKAISASSSRNIKEWAVSDWNVMVTCLWRTKGFQHHNDNFAMRELILRHVLSLILHGLLVFPRNLNNDALSSRHRVVSNTYGTVEGFQVIFHQCKPVLPDFLAVQQNSMLSTWDCLPWIAAILNHNAAQSALTSGWLQSAALSSIVNLKRTGWGSSIQAYTQRIDSSTEKRPSWSIYTHTEHH